MRKAAWMSLALAVGFGGGCHAKFKREAPGLGAVRTHVVISGGPYVQLGQAQGDSLAAAVVNVVQAVKSAELAPKIAASVRIDDVNYAMQEGVRDTLGDGPPFTYTTNDAAPMLQLEVMSYGLYVPTLGAPGEFAYDVRVRIYKPDGDRVYSTRLRCATGAGDPEAVEVVFQVVNNSRALKDMSPEEIHNSFAEIARWCGTRLVIRMRRHAG
jgi:hypothetical protein